MWASLGFLTQLAIIGTQLHFVSYVGGIQQSGCANYYQLTPLPLCDGTPQIPGVGSGGGVTSGGLPPPLPNLTAPSPNILPPPSNPSPPPTVKAPAPTSNKYPGKMNVTGSFGSRNKLFARDQNFFSVNPSAPTGEKILTTSQPSKAVAGGTGICGSYDTTKDMGVCLWTGTDDSGNDPDKSGWLNGAAAGNCQLEVEVWRISNPQNKHLAKVLDGCSLDIKDYGNGCQNMFLTKRLVSALDPTASEEISGLAWRFKKPQNIF